MNGESPAEAIEEAVEDIAEEAHDEAHQEAQQVHETAPLDLTSILNETRATGERLGHMGSQLASVDQRLMEHEQWRATTDGRLTSLETTIASNLRATEEALSELSENLSPDQASSNGSETGSTEAGTETLIVSHDAGGDGDQSSSRNRKARLFRSRFR